MMLQNTLTTLAFAASTLASPLVARQETPTSDVSLPEVSESSVPKVYDWSADWKTKFPIHESCNSTLRAQLEEALDELQQLAGHARDHILRFGHKSDLVKKYFGNGTTATPIGWYDRVVSADKSGMLFRCDDPDKNCETQDGKGLFLHTL